MEFHYTHIQYILISLSKQKNIKKNQQSGGQSKKYCMANSKSKKSIGICPREYLDNSLIFYKREEKTS